MNAVGTLVHVHMGAGERYLWTLPMFHANGWTFTWIVTAVGGTHVCLRKVEPARIFAEIARESITMLCAAPTVLIGIANAPEDAARGRAPGRARADGRRAAGGGDHRARRGRARLGHHARLRPHRDRAVHHDLRVAPGARRALGRGARRDQGATGRGARHVGRAPRRRTRTATRCRTTARRSARSSCAATSS